ncbi:MAG: mechanosensitive ion channel [Anaerolineales bacterium]|nr:mechanosensitive ion channel [Anaerolineales bacterium]
MIGLVIATVLSQVAQRRWRIGYQHWSAEGSGFIKKLVSQFFLQLTSGILALALIKLAKIILAGQGARTALIDSFSGIVLLYLGLKFVLAIVFAIGNVASIGRYQKTFILPLVIVIVGVQVLGVFFPGERLGNMPVFYLFDNTVTLYALFLITVGFYLWVVGTQAAGQGIHFLATQYGGADPGSTQATLTLLRYFLIIVGLGYVLFRLNFNTTTIAAISGGLSVGIGFALSTILSNFVSGILLLFEHTLYPGDIIEYNGILCTVEMISIRSIRVRTFDNIEMIIPNSEFVTAPFTTYTGKSRHVRLKLPIGTSYDDDYKHVMKTLLDVVNAYPHIMKDPAPDVRLENFGDFSIDYQLYVWIANPLLSAQVKNELHQAILDAFAEKGITIPFPTAIEIQQDSDSK